MALEKSGHVALPEGNARKRGRESWAEILRRWLVECPCCSEVWFVVGARDDDSYICKDCGHRFVIRLPGARKDSQSDPALGERRHK